MKSSATTTAKAKAVKPSATSTAKPFNLGGWLGKSLKTLSSATTTLNATLKVAKGHKYINDGLSAGQKYIDASSSYVGTKAHEGGQLIGQKVSEAAHKSYQIAREQNRALWRLIAVKQRVSSLARLSYKWIVGTRTVRNIRAAAILGIIGKAGYVYGTYFEREITVTKSSSDEIGANGSKSRSFNQLRETSSGVHNTYFVADQEKRLYQVVPSFWFMQWWPDEMWAFMKEGETYKILGYGWRIQKLRLHPRIALAQKKIDYVEGAPRLEDYEDLPGTHNLPLLYREHVRPYLTHSYETVKSYLNSWF